LVELSAVALNSPNGYDTFVMRVTGATVDGHAVTVPGLDSEYGLYIEGTVAVSPSNEYGPGTIALLLDPTNNDGSLLASFNNATQTGGVSFSNPAGTADDITLASGQFVSGEFNTTNPSLLLVNTFNPDAAISKLLHGTALNIQTDLFNTATSRTTGTTASGQTYVMSNEGNGVVTLVPASDATTPDNVPVKHLLADLDDMGFLHGGHAGRG